jgi:hypothetical protein
MTAGFSGPASPLKGLITTLMLPVPFVVVRSVVDRVEEPELDDELEPAWCRFRCRDLGNERVGEGTGRLAVARAVLRTVLLTPGPLVEPGQVEVQHRERLAFRRNADLAIERTTVRPIGVEQGAEATVVAVGRVWTRSRREPGHVDRRPVDGRQRAPRDVPPLDGERK